MINKKFNKIIELILKYINEGYVILLESDLVSLMFHSYLLLEENIPNKIHINSRISQSKSDREKIDFVIGEIINPKKLRPKIEPEIIVEVKAIPELGFNDRQKEKRYQTIIKDIKKIKNIRQETYNFQFNCSYVQFTNLNPFSYAEPINVFYENESFLKTNSDKILHFEDLQRFTQCDLEQLIGSNSKKVFIIDKNEISGGKIKIKEVKGGTSCFLEQQ